MTVLEGYKPIQDREGGNPRTHEVNYDHSFGSRTPVIEDDPRWTGFSAPEWMRINSPDERKKYK